MSLISENWDDVLRLAGSLKLGLVPATGIMSTLQVGEKATSLAKAMAEIGRIEKTVHSLTYMMVKPNVEPSYSLWGSEHSLNSWNLSFPLSIEASDAHTHI